MLVVVVALRVAAAREGASECVGPLALQALLNPLTGLRAKQGLSLKGELSLVVVVGSAP